MNIINLRHLLLLLLLTCSVMGGCKSNSDMSDLGENQDDEPIGSANILLEEDLELLQEGDQYFQEKSYKNALNKYIAYTLFAPKEENNRDRAIYMAAKCLHVLQDKREKLFIDMLQEEYPNSKYNKYILQNYGE